MQLINLLDRYDIDRKVLPVADVTGGTVHHTVTRTPTAAWTEDEELAVLDAIDRYHRERHWRDRFGNLVSLGGFAYHLAVFPSRRAYYVTPLGMRGAHIAWLNHRYLSIVLIGTFTVVAPVSPQVVTAIDGRFWIEDAIGKTIPWAGHRDLADNRSPTSCPGNTWRTWVPVIATAREARNMYTDAELDARFKAIGDRLDAIDARLREGAPPAPPPPEPTPEPRIYVVVASDGAEGLSGIALRELGDAGRWPEIAQLNGLTPPYIIHVDDRLTLPAS